MRRSSYGAGCTRFVVTLGQVPASLISSVPHRFLILRLWAFSFSFRLWCFAQVGRRAVDQTPSYARLTAEVSEERASTSQAPAAAIASPEEAAAASTRSTSDNPAAVPSSSQTAAAAAAATSSPAAGEASVTHRKTTSPTTSANDR